MNIQDPGFRFAPPWASDVYHAFGVLLGSELLKLPYCRVFFTLNMHRYLFSAFLKPLEGRCLQRPDARYKKIWVALAKNRGSCKQVQTRP